MRESPTLDREHLNSAHSLQCSTQPSDLAGLVRLTRMDRIAKAMGGRVDKAGDGHFCATNSNVAKPSSYMFAI